MAAPSCIRARFTSMCRNLFVEKTPLAFVFCRNTIPCKSGWRNASTCSATVTRTRRKVYSRMYKIRLVQPDGSSYFIRYKDPFKIITQPVDPATMTEEERRERLKRLMPEKPKEIYEAEEEDDGDYDQRSWSKLMKKR